MAGLIQDSNTNATYGHSAADMKKSGLKFSARKPLGGISNSANPFRKKASEKMVRKKNLAVFEEEIGTRAKKNISKASGTRKGLADISNSIRHQSSRKKQNTEKCIAYEEYDPHDHQACMKAQECKALDMDDFFKTLGLANGCPKEKPSLKRPETPPRSPLRFLEETLTQPFSRYVSPNPLPPKSTPLPPKSTDDDQFWKYWDDIIDSLDVVKR